MSELWIVHHSVVNWQDPSQWTNYFKEAQRILGSPLSHLDFKDPVKRKVDPLTDAGSFICSFKANENSRWLFGKLADSGIEFSIQHYRHLGYYPNTLKWHVPLSFLKEPASYYRLKALFDLGNQTLKPFYAYGDNLVQIAKKRKSSGSVDIQAELLGIFWFTYFNGAYVAFFGPEKFLKFKGVEHGNDGSITIALGEKIESPEIEVREQMAAALGRQSFIDPSDIIGKQQGQFALTFQQLLDEG